MGPTSRPPKTVTMEFTIKLTDITAGLPQKIYLRGRERKNFLIDLCVVCYFFFDVTSRVSLLSLSDKSTVGMVGNTDYATGSFCSSCSVEPTLPSGSWLDGKGCAMCSYDNGG